MNVSGRGLEGGQRVSAVSFVHSTLSSLAVSPPVDRNASVGHGHRASLVPQLPGGYQQGKPARRVQYQRQAQGKGPARQKRLRFACRDDVKVKGGDTHGVKWFLRHRLGIAALLWPRSHPARQPLCVRVRSRVSGVASLCSSSRVGSANADPDLGPAGEHALRGLAVVMMTMTTVVMVMVTLMTRRRRR